MLSVSPFGRPVGQVPIPYVRIERVFRGPGIQRGGFQRRLAQAACVQRAAILGKASFGFF